MASETSVSTTRYRIWTTANHRWRLELDPTEPSISVRAGALYCGWAQGRLFAHWWPHPRPGRPRRRRHTYGG